MRTYRVIGIPRYKNGANYILFDILVTRNSERPVYVCTHYFRSAFGENEISKAIFALPRFLFCTGLANDNVKY